MEPLGLRPDRSIKAALHPFPLLTSAITHHEEGPGALQVETFSKALWKCAPSEIHPPPPPSPHFSMQDSFDTIGISLLQTMVMMLGEVEFTTIFITNKSKVPYPGVSYLIYSVFVVLVPILLMNLLVSHLSILTNQQFIQFTWCLWLTRFHPKISDFQDLRVPHLKFFWCSANPSVYWWLNF